VFDKLPAIIKQLRSKDGCPWDREQTHESLKPYLVEESYEVIEAIDKGDPDILADELGDLLLQILLHAQIASEQGHFDIKQVVKNISEKMVRRHPHVFGDTKVKGVKDVWQNWEHIKKNEKKNKEQQSIMDSVPNSFPALYRASKLQKKASRVGFDWPDKDGAWQKVKEEIKEFDKEIADGGDKKKIIEEYGDILFALVNVGRKLDMDAEDALRLASKKFEKRFKYVEQQVNEQNKNFKDFSLSELDIFWEESKKQKNTAT